MHDNETRAFLDQLPELRSGERFPFTCDSEAPCFNECCRELELALYPYDVLRLRRGLALSSRRFIELHADVDAAQGTGFPRLLLRMRDDERRSCPFVRAEGCSVYSDRPAACRTYPLGRAVGGEGTERFCLVREAHCRGFESQRAWTSERWIEDQGLGVYNEANDSFTRLVARCSPLDDRQRALALLCLYQLDDFVEFAAKVGLFDRLAVDREEQRAIVDDEEARLRFALRWLEIALAGEAR